MADIIFFNLNLFLCIREYWTVNKAFELAGYGNKCKSTEDKGDN